MRALHLIFLFFNVKASACCLVSRHGVSVGQFFSIDPKAWWVRDTLKCELGKKEVWTLNVVLINELRESRVTYGSENSGDLSFRDTCFGKSTACAKDLSLQAMLIPDAKATVDKEWKRVSKGTHNNRESPLCCIDRHSPIQKYMYIPVNVKSNLKWGNNVVLDESVHV